MPRTVNPTQPPSHRLKILPISSGTVAGIVQVGFVSGGRRGKATHAPGLSFLKGRKMVCACVCVSTRECLQPCTCLDLVSREGRDAMQ